MDHGWVGALVQNPTLKKTHPHGILAIFDITNRVRGEGTQQRNMNLGPCPNPSTEAGAKELAKAFLATMTKPSEKPPSEREGIYYQPRRPAWILLEPDLAPALKVVAEELAEVNVAVQLNTPEALSNADGAETTAEDSQGRLATWDAGLAMGATEENVKALPLHSEDVWKCSMTMLEDQATGSKECFMAVEDITAGTGEEDSFPVGVGPCPAATVNPNGMVRALFATMLSPRANGGGGYGTARRPGRVVLDKPLEPWLEHIQSKVGNVGVSVEI